MPTLTHDFTESLPAPPERVFAALTDESQLTRWFAESAEIDPRAGGEFRFWGKYTCGTPARWQARQKLLRIEPPTLIEFAWPFGDGCDSEVTLTLTRDPNASGGEGTILKGRHHFPEAPATDRPLDLVDDMWRIACANLRGFLANDGDAGICLPDYSDAVPRIRPSARRRGA